MSVFTVLPAMPHRFMDQKPMLISRGLRALLRNAILYPMLFVGLYGCTNYQSEQATVTVVNACSGSSHLPADLAKKFEPTINKQLLNEALGEARQGKLCQGKVYRSNAESSIVVYRAWNSTNPESEFGKWWALKMPTGKVSTYRSDYEICYQWSPLDKLVRCRLKPGIEVVVGTGQSAECSEYLTYPISDKQQIYIENAAASVDGCVVFDGEFNWKRL
jgi:hypothetical protein